MKWTAFCSLDSEDSFYFYFDTEVLPRDDDSISMEAKNEQTGKIHTLEFSCKGTNWSYVDGTLQAMIFFYPSCIVTPEDLLAIGWKPA